MSEQTNSNSICRWCVSCGDVHTLDPKQWHKISNQGGVYYLGTTPVSFTLIHDPYEKEENDDNGHHNNEKEEFVCNQVLLQNEKTFQQLVISLQTKTHLKEEEEEEETKQRVTGQKSMQTEGQGNNSHEDPILKNKSKTNLEDLDEFGILEINSEEENMEGKKKEIEIEIENENENENDNEKERDQKKETEHVSNKEQENESTLCKCGICFDTSVEPVLTSCGHLFCWPCLSQWLQIGKRTCPICKNPLRKKKHIIPIYNSTQNSELKNHSYDKLKKLPRRSHRSRSQQRHGYRNGIRLPNGDIIPLNQTRLNFSAGLGSFFNYSFGQRPQQNRNQNGNENENQNLNRPEQTRQTVFMRILIVLVIFLLIVISEFSYY
ncbi:hypothetical protein M0813_08548 [Anaeramoeba flamelloides]|uniref:RING-type E3 ubiquitin transferase n=1 Tax=Anaeramoeba flamelloides TaxID=1746091 RepID=A0ABQ8X8P3_9EUKA|nr:hypothetical protein M0813_08548 [Anaeramoeba flamelloides]